MYAVPLVMCLEQTPTLIPRVGLGLALSPQHFCLAIEITMGHPKTSLPATRRTASFALRIVYTESSDSVTLDALLKISFKPVINLPEDKPPSRQHPLGYESNLWLNGMIGQSLAYSSLLKICKWWLSVPLIPRSEQSRQINILHCSVSPIFSF